MYLWPQWSVPTRVAVKRYTAVIQTERHCCQTYPFKRAITTDASVTPRHTRLVVRFWTQCGLVPDTWQTSGSMCILGWSGRCFFCSANSSMHADNSGEWTVALMMAEQPRGLWHAFILSKPQLKGAPRPPSRQTNRHDAAMDECRLLTVWFLRNQKKNKNDVIWFIDCFVTIIWQKDKTNLISIRSASD